MKRALTGFDDECGDTGIIRKQDSECFFALIDGVGHGRDAHEVAELAESFLLAYSNHDLVKMMNGLHACLGQSRGAVAALCRLNLLDGVLHFVGIGNITVRILGERDYRLVSRDGIIGYMIASPRQQEERLYPGDTVILSSDGIKEHFDPYEYPGLFTGSAQKIAADIMDKLGKGNDDASCIVLRYVR